MSELLVPLELGLRRIARPTVLELIFLDSSGSMLERRHVTEEAINGHLAALKDQDDETDYICGIVIFADWPAIMVPFTRVDDVPPLRGYCPEGSTLLWATVDEGMRRLLDLVDQTTRQDRDQLRIVVDVFTDGKDRRSSRDVYPQRLQETARLAIEAGWELYTRGIGISALKIAEEMGFPADDEHAKTFEGSIQGVREASLDMTQTMTVGGGAAWRQRTQGGSTTDP